MRVIYVDDEKPALDNFRLMISNFDEVSSVQLFRNGNEAYEYAKEHTIDVAFLDMEMPGIHGLSLAKKLKSLNPDIRVIFVTAYSQYALDAWHVDATDYLLKPYSTDDIRKALEKCNYHALPSQRIVIRTIPTLSISVNGVPVPISGAKPREMLALLVDCGESGFTVGEGIACLWPNRVNDAGAQSLLRMTYKRLSDTLEAAGAGHILVTNESRRCLKVDAVECDLYRILAGDEKAALSYHGEYLQEYSWAEERNSQLYWMLMGKEKTK